MSSPENDLEQYSPVMRQYWTLKKECGQALLFFRMGDFYELFADDAVQASKLLGITLTSRDKKSENPVPMAGVPFHSAQSYIQKCLSSGRKVAIAEQITDPTAEQTGPAKIADRKIVRVFTPAVQFESTEVEPGRLAILYVHDSKKSSYGWIQCAPATGEIWVSKPSSREVILSDPSWAIVKHVLYPMGKIPVDLIQPLDAMDGILVEEIAFNLVTEERAENYLRDQYQLLALGQLLEEPTAKHALALLVRYICQSQKVERLAHLKLPKNLHEPSSLKFGMQTFHHLDGEDLFNIINTCSTSMGTRALRQLFLNPEIDPGQIRHKQETIQAIAESKTLITTAQKMLAPVYDLDRILGRVSTGLANPRDTLALGQSLKQIEDLSNALPPIQTKYFSVAARQLRDYSTALATMADEIVRTQKEDAPIHTRDAGIFKRGTHTDLDQLIDLCENGDRFLVELETRERTQTGISSLKVKFNRVFGYFIEVSTANLKLAPAHYLRKQTMVGGERFFTEELKKFEEEILNAETRRKNLEQELFDGLIARLKSKISELQILSEQVGLLDAWIAIAKMSTRPGWSFPTIDDSHSIHLKNCRHPVLEINSVASSTAFVPNTIDLNGLDDRIWIITGPNMGGKSTLMRQVALILWLGQMGAPVPATEAQFGAIDSLFTRIGAQDALSKGLSTFMVEMTELAQILHQTTKRSFIILDEVGRGTSTYDGMSVAWATIEHLAQQTHARVLFATHYHELTGLPNQMRGLKNFHMRVEELRGKLRFLYEIAEGPSAKSFGIQVARLAGIPTSVIQRSWQILRELEQNGKTHQLDLFQTQLETANAPETPATPVVPIEPVAPQSVAGLTFQLVEEMLESMQQMNVDELRPIDALQWLTVQQQKIANSKGSS